MHNVRTYIGAITLLLALWICPAPTKAALQDVPVKSKTTEVPFTSHDGHEMFGKLTVPVSGGPHPVVIYVQTAEGMTVDMKRPNGRGGTFNYQFRDERATGFSPPAFRGYLGESSRRLSACGRLVDSFLMQYN